MKRLITLLKRLKRTSTMTEVKGLDNNHGSKVPVETLGGELRNILNDNVRKSQTIDGATVDALDAGEDNNSQPENPRESNAPEMIADRMSLTYFPPELLRLILEYCAHDVETLCALDASSKTMKSLTPCLWGQISSRDYGSGRAGKRSYMAGRALTTRPPTCFRLENEMLSGRDRYASHLAASKSIIVMGVSEHLHNRGHLHNFPLTIVTATTLKPQKCWPIRHEPCRQVVVVENDIVVLQTDNSVLWACQGCIKVKVLLPSEEDGVCAFAGSAGGLALVQNLKLCLYKPSSHTTLTLYDTVDLSEEDERSTYSAMNWSACGKYLAIANARKVKVFTWGTKDVLTELITFQHSQRMFFGGTIAVSEKYVCLVRTPSANDNRVRVFSMPGESGAGGKLLQTMGTAKSRDSWSGPCNSRFHVSIVGHFIMITPACGVGLELFDARDGRLVRQLPTDLENCELHDMVQLTGTKSLTYVVSYNGGNQMVWEFEGCHELL